MFRQLKFKKVYLLTTAIFLAVFILSGCDKKEVIEQESQENQPVQEKEAKEEIKTKLNANKSLVLCKSGEEYFGEEIIKKGLVFKAISGMMFYNADELVMLCNPKITDFNEETDEFNFHIFVSYKNINYSEYEGDRTAEEYLNDNKGYYDGRSDGENLTRKIKHSYKEPEAEDHLKNRYFYGYLKGYLDGCKEINRECEEAEKLISYLENLPSD